MGGSSDTRPASPRRRRRDGDAGGDPCAIELEIDLVSLQPLVSATLAIGDVLKVMLDSMPPAVSVICRTTRGEVVGSLSAFLGLVQLIKCVEQGVDYEATVLSASMTRCTVLVRQARAS